MRSLITQRCRVFCAGQLLGINNLPGGYLWGLVCYRSSWWQFTSGERNLQAYPRRPLAPFMFMQMRATSITSPKTSTTTSTRHGSRLMAVAIANFLWRMEQMKEPVASQNYDKN